MGTGGEDDLLDGLQDSEEEEEEEEEVPGVYTQTLAAAEADRHSNVCFGRLL